MTDTTHTPQVKVCGLKRIEEAMECAIIGVNAIGLVFYPKSPRYVTEEVAKTISMALPKEINKVGIFVDETFATIMRKVERCRLTAVQLHRRESPELVRCLRKENLLVIKALFSEGTPSMENASEYDASAFLVECGQGLLPGGNALEWNWATAKEFGDKHPLILAGGLTADNVSGAITASRPDAVDVSSGVEYKPGGKDLKKVKAFMDAVFRCRIEKTTRRIF
jgi:phosphoribosylanthranilate isomerase